VQRWHILYTELLGLMTWRRLVAIFGGMIHGLTMRISQCELTSPLATRVVQPTTHTFIVLVRRERLRLALPGHTGGDMASTLSMSTIMLA
jgi:hypothetical protein